MSGKFDFNQCDGIPGFISKVFEAYDRFRKNKSDFSDRFTRKDGEIRARWEHFMVDDGINTQWMRDTKGNEVENVKGEEWWEHKVSNNSN